MREIKFRAFDTKNKKWLCGYEQMGGFGLMGECVIFGEWANQLGPIDQWKDISIMQFTGLKDKNGKEIYEGDIVQDITDWTFIKCGSKTHCLSSSAESIDTEKNGHFTRYIVEYNGAGFDPFQIPSLGGYEYEDLNAGKCEVIGNIQQNPELLNP